MADVSVFSVLYPIVPLVGLAGFLPQIINLIKITQPPASISLPTWGIWTLTWLISLGYAVFSVHDMLFATTAAMNLIGHILIIGLSVYKHHKYGAYTLGRLFALQRV